MTDYTAVGRDGLLARIRELEASKATVHGMGPAEPLTFESYQAERESFFGEPRPTPERLASAALGLCGEAGEVAEIVKKHQHHGKPFDCEHFVEELGDVLWYVMYAAGAVGCSLEEVARSNSAKLLRRYPAGFVKGGGVR